MKRISLFLFLVVLMAWASSSMAEVLDRPTGIRIGQRMTLRPYVSMSVGWDSNPAQSHSDADGDLLWTINPGVGLDYKAENWALRFNAFYNFRSYTRASYVQDRNRHSFGEDLNWAWSNAKRGEKGWALRLSEFFQQINMADDLSYGNGSNYNGDRREFNVQALVERRFTEKVHANLDAHFYSLEYDNDMSASYASYGWQRWSGALMGGYVLSPWTDILLTGGYQGYRQNNTGLYNVGNSSQGYTVQTGFGSYATDRISYRLLMGWSRFEYGEGFSSNDGFSYTLTANWKISDTWHTMFVGSSYYQPSEQDMSSSTRVDSFAWGLAKSLVRAKLRGTLDMTYRHETREVASTRSNSDYALDVVTARLGFNYVMNRFLTFFAYGEYLRSFNDEADRDNGRWDYDRWRVTGGVKFTY